MEAPRDELVRTVSADGSVSVRVVAATHLVREAVRRHGTSATASVALGRTLMGALLLASGTQDGERIQVLVRGDGPLGTITVTADAEGAVRGYVQHPAAELPPRDGRLDVAGGVGLGILTVERNHPSWKQPYSGVVPLVSGEIAKDLASYLLESEQKPAALALGVYLGPGGAVEAAAGYLIQRLPGAPDEALAGLEERVAGAAHPSELVRAGASAEVILAHLLGDLGASRLSRLEPRFVCPCTPERVRRAALLLGREEIRDIARRGEPLEVRCAFCAEVYLVEASQLASESHDA